MLNDASLTPDRARGALLGLAVGDALGTTLEFGPRRERGDYHTEVTGGGPFRLPAGAWTDDTAMALALGASLVANEGVVVRSDLLDRFAKWLNYGEYSCTGTCFDVGNQTRAAIRGYELSGLETNNGGDQKAGNGGIMRLAPAAIVAGSSAEARVLSITQSSTTHNSLACREYASKLGYLLYRLVESGVMPEDPAYAELRDRPRAEVKSGGHVVECYEAALWSVLTTDTFEDAVIEAVNLGGDADTTGAVAGQIAGALYGASAIPSRWLDAILWRGRITTLADELCALRRVAA